MTFSSRADYSYQIGPYLLAVFGKQTHFCHGGLEIAEEQAAGLGITKDKLALAIVASDHNSLGFQQVYAANFTETMRADGILLTEPGSAGVIQTGDCAVIALYHRKTEDVVLTHAGRNALSDINRCVSCSVVTEAVRRLLTTGGEVVDIVALVTGNICGPCFVHADEGAEDFITPFRKYPADARVFANEKTGALDLYQVIKHQLMFEGVPETNIRHEGSCTLETDVLASYRGGDALIRNTFILGR